MRKAIVAVFAIKFIISSGVTFAQTEPSPGLQEKLRLFGEARYCSDLGQAFIADDVQPEIDWIGDAITKENATIDIGTDKYVGEGRRVQASYKDLTDSCVRLHKFIRHKFPGLRISQLQTDIDTPLTPTGDQRVTERGLTLMTIYAVASKCAGYNVVFKQDQIKMQ